MRPYPILITLGVLAITFAVAVVTIPKDDQHERALLFTPRLTVSKYYGFSVGRIRYGDRQEVVSIGIFRRVFVLKDPDRTALKLQHEDKRDEFIRIIVRANLLGKVSAEEQTEIFNKFVRIPHDQGHEKEIHFMDSVGAAIMQR